MREEEAPLIRDKRIPGKDYSNTRFESAITIEESSIPELFFNRAAAHPDEIFAEYRRDDERKCVTWREASEHVALLAFFLRKRFDLKLEQRVALLSATRYEWVIADLALLSAGAVSIPVYHSLSTPEVGYILWNSDAEVVFAENNEQIEKLKNLDQTKTLIPKTEYFPGGKQQLKVRAVISFEEATSERFKARLFSFWEIVSGNEYDNEAKQEITSSVARSLKDSNTITRESMASIVYTSGTTGPPKGVVQTHNNHLAMLESVEASGFLGEKSRLFLFLPLAHSFARLIAYAAISSSSSILLPTTINKRRSLFDAKQLFRDVHELEPDIFPSVPRLYEKVMTGLTGKLSDKSSSWKESLQKKLARWALKAFPKLEAKRHLQNRLSPLETLRHTIAKGIVGRICETVFGSRLKFCVSGGAPLDLAVAQFFDSLGVTICEGYGLTETTPAMAANTIHFNRYGSVGRAFPGIEIRISEEDGEILCRGKNVAQGYFKLPQATKEVFFEDGWFATGDIGRIDEDGYLFITDRKKDLIITAGGKNIAPALIEGRTKSSPYISQVLVYGDRKPYLVALVTLDEENITNWLGGDISRMAEKKEEVRELIKSELERLTAEFANFEQIKRFRILDEDFTVANGLLSPTMKMKRRKVVRRYRREIEELYRREEN